MCLSECTYECVAERSSRVEASDCSRCVMPKGGGVRKIAVCVLCVGKDCGVVGQRECGGSAEEQW